MENTKFVKKLIERSKGFDIQKYKDSDFKKTHRPFEGTPKKHPNDKNILILLTRPFSDNKKFFEFSIDSIGHIEELGTVTSEKGQTAYRIRVWVKKGMPGLKAEPFIVD